MGVAGERVTGRYGGHCQGSGKNPLPDAGRFAEYRFQMFVSLAISFLVNTAWGFYFYILLSRIYSRQGKNPIG